MNCVPQCQATIAAPTAVPNVQPPIVKGEWVTLWVSAWTVKEARATAVASFERVYGFKVSPRKVHLSGLV